MLNEACVWPVLVTPPVPIFVMVTVPEPISALRTLCPFPATYRLDRGSKNCTLDFVLTERSVVPGLVRSVKIINVDALV